MLITNKSGNKRLSEEDPASHDDTKKSSPSSEAVVNPSTNQTIIKPSELNFQGAFTFDLPSVNLSDKNKDRPTFGSSAKKGAKVFHLPSDEKNGSSSKSSKGKTENPSSEEKDFSARHKRISR